MNMQYKENEMDSQQNKKVTNKYPVLKVAILVASLVSFFTTFTGMYAVSDIDPLEAYHKSTIMIFMVVFLIQASLIFALQYFEWNKLLNTETFVKHFAALVLYLGTTVLSVIFSFAFYYEKLSAGEHSKRSMNLQLNKVDGRLLNASNSLELVVTSLKSLSQYSLKKSDDEQNNGGTCSEQKLTGYGDLTQIRLDDSALTKMMYEKVEAISKSLTNDIENLRKDVSSYSKQQSILKLEKSVNQRIKLINSKYFNGDTYQLIKDELVNRSGANRKHLTGFNTKTRVNFNRSCVDRGFTKEVSRVVKRLEALQQVKMVKFFDTENKKELIARTGNVFLAIAGYKQIKNVDEMINADDVTFNDMKAIGFAIFIDALIFLLSIIDKKPYQRRRTLSLDKVKAILNGEIANSVYTKLRPYISESFGKYFIAVPNNLQEVHSLDPLIQYMKFKGLVKTYAHRVHWDKLKKHFDPNLIESYPESNFTVYKMNKQQLETLLLEDISGEVE